MREKVRIYILSLARVCPGDCLSHYLRGQEKNEINGDEPIISESLKF